MLKKNGTWDLEAVNKPQPQLSHTVPGQRLEIHNSDTGRGMKLGQATSLLLLFCDSCLLHSSERWWRSFPIWTELILPIKLPLVLKIQRYKTDYFYVASSQKPSREQKLNDLFWEIFSSLSPVSLGKCIIWWAPYLCIFILILFRAKVKHSKGWVKRSAIAEKAIWLQMKDLVKWVFYAASFYKEKGKCSAHAVPLMFFWLNLEELGQERNSGLRVHNSLRGCLTWVMVVLCKQCFKESTTKC